MLRIIYKLSAWVVCLLLLGCLSTRSQVKVALDPSWYHAHVSGRANSVTPFAMELLYEIGEREGLSLQVYQNGWDNLTLGLELGYYDAICSSLPPYLFYEKTFAFSEPFLLTGPVVVVREDTGEAWEKIPAHIVGIVEHCMSAPLVARYGNHFERIYPSAAQGLNALQQRSIDALLVDVLTAEAFVADLYQGQLKIVSPPLTSEGLRWVSLQGKRSEQLIRDLNRGLEHLKAQGRYKALTEEWGLSIK